MQTTEQTERWGIFEVSLKGPQDGNPFVDVTLSAQFKYKNRLIEPNGFYDGDGLYRIRLMPDAVGLWSYVTQSNVPALDEQTGEFTCIEPAPENHGPVRVRDTFHFAYQDGTPHFSIGTTSYVWNHQGDELEEQTLATLREAPFNKMRMCVFPKDYAFNQNEPEYYPFAGTPLTDWDFSRFNPAFFQHLEKRIGDLLELGIEADIILFHPYDRWGFATMSPETDDFYLRYVVARLAAYRNVWWSMANEYDLMESKTLADWDRFFQIVQESDPYQHLRSIHNCHEFYDHGKPWVTHQSIQRSDLQQTREWRKIYQKPVVVDECCYEGNIQQAWGNISAEELVHRFWSGTIGGGYVGHGETYLHSDDILWWSKGGVLHGQSSARIAFLRKILADGPPEGFTPIEAWPYWGARKTDDYYLYYFGVHQPAELSLEFSQSQPYQVEIIDPWEMTITPLAGTFSGQFKIELPGKPYLALRVWAIE
jgi:hypothetical protein